jgi:hypothetical protein
LPAPKPCTGSATRTGDRHPEIGGVAPPEKSGSSRMPANPLADSTTEPFAGRLSSEVNQGRRGDSEETSQRDQSHHQGR